MCLNRRWQATQDDSYLQVFSTRPVSFDVISEGMNPSMNGSLNGSLSSDGIAFWADHEPKMNAILSVMLDNAMLANCSEVEHDVLRVDHSVVGKVSSVERDELANEVIVKMSFLRRNAAFMSESAKREAVVNHV